MSNNLAIIFGGPSPEHDISILTGLQTSRVLSSKNKVLNIYWSRDNKWFLVDNNLESKDFIDENIKLGINIFLEIDVQGFQQLKLKNVEFRSIFILPPSIKELRNRIQKRGLDSEDVIEKRMRNALKELNKANEYDYLIINNVLDEAVKEMLEIVKDKGFQDEMHDKKTKILQDLLS